MIRFGALPFIRLVCIRSVKSMQFLTISSLRLDKLILSQFEKKESCLEIIMDYSERARNWKRSCSLDHFQWSENHNNGCLAGLRALFHAKFLNPRLLYPKLSRKACCTQIRVKIILNLTIRWRKMNTRPLDTVLNRFRLVPSSFHSVNSDKRIENHWWRHWKMWRFDCNQIIWKHIFCIYICNSKDPPKITSVSVCLFRNGDGKLRTLARPKYCVRVLL